MQQIRTLSKGQIEDPTILLDILMDLPSDGEVVEACLVNIGRSGAVSAFATDFIRCAFATITNFIACAILQRSQGRHHAGTGTTCALWCAVQ